MSLKHENMTTPTLHDILQVLRFVLFIGVLLCFCNVWPMGQMGWAYNKIDGLGGGSHLQEI